MAAYSGRGRAVAAMVAGEKCGRAVLPAWQELEERAKRSAVCSRIAGEDRERASGRGPPHRASKLRLFRARSEDEVRVTLYRDSAAWCPYCQKLWILLEEKEIPYRVELINMRSYGDKPKDYLAKVRNGVLPALELDGQMMTESLDIMAICDETFTQDMGHRSMLPPRGTAAWKRVEHLLRLERQLFSAWCGYVFHSGPGRAQFERAMSVVEAALGETPGPWFLESEGPTLVDLQYVSHVERMAASVPYWKGVALRGSGTYPNIDRWFEAFEQRASYLATKSDWYTHIKDIPPQYGSGVAVPEAAEMARALDGGDASWQLPLPPLKDSDAWSDRLQPGWEAMEADAPHEAASRLLANHQAIAKFMSRGAGPGGGWARGRPDRCQLSDPYAPAVEDLQLHTDAALRIIVAVLLDGATPGEEHMAMTDALAEAAGEKALAPLAACCAYLRDRVGVPRDVSYPGARALRGSLNYVISQLRHRDAIRGA